LGTYNIARKNTLGIHLKKFKKEFPDDYNFFPHTWIWPSDMHELVEYNTRKMAVRKQELESGRLTLEQDKKDPAIMFISKPGGGCQGRGIQIMKNFEQLKEKMEQAARK
jgi:tubulin polyglutamylase TTLL6/13